MSGCKRVILCVQTPDSIVLNYFKGRMLSSFGDRSISVAVPKLWNSLPASLSFVTLSHSVVLKLT